MCCLLVGFGNSVFCAGVHKKMQFVPSRKEPKLSCIPFFNVGKEHRQKAERTEAENAHLVGTLYTYPEEIRLIHFLKMGFQLRKQTSIS